jgi:hypothetical protein
MRSPEPFENEDINHLRLYLYLIPVIGFLPAFWTLYNRDGNRVERNVSRQSITLTLGWLLTYFLLAAGADASEPLATPLLIASSLVTSSYFLLNFWLMVRLWQRKSLRLPGVSQISDRIP